MSEEERRLQTFLGWPRKRPSARALAGAGFVYTGQGDCVRCQFCKISAINWEPNDDPVEEHRRLSPRCSFLLGLDITAESDASKSDAPTPTTNGSEEQHRLQSSFGWSRLRPSAALRKMFARKDRNTTAESSPPEGDASMPATTMSEEQRLQTFVGWPQPGPSAEALARAGFVYTGQDDRVCCQVCKIAVLNWEPNDDPVAEHRRLRPLCPFLLGLNTTAERNASKNDAPTPTTNVSEAQRRLQTFVGWPRPGPSAEAMARAGFVYTGQGDCVCCQFCKIAVLNWESNDDPVAKHRRLKPLCPFLQGLNTTAERNASENDAPTPTTNVSEEQRRLQTFVGWPRPRPSAEAMARAGFVYTGKRDHVRCQICKIAVLNWGPNDDPLAEHRKHCPQCSFLQGLDITAERNTLESEAQRLATNMSEEEHRLQSFFGWPLSRPSAEAMALAGFIYTGQADRVNCDFCPLTLRNWKPNDDPVEDHRRCSPWCPFLQDLDTNAERSASGSDVRTPTTNAESGQAAPAQQGSELSEEPALSHTASELNEEPALSDTASDNRHLRDEKLCKICLESEARTVFLPCSHLATCPVCAAEIHVCCICRSPIERKIDVFLA